MAATELASEQPSLKQALAIAIVAKRRRDASLEQCRKRSADLEQELDRLKAMLAAAAQRSPLELLGTFISQQQHQPSSQQQQPSQGGLLDSQLASLAMWVHAAASEGTGGPGFILALQHYLLQKDAAAVGGSTPALAPTVRLLERTPMAAVLELLSDLLAAAAVPTGGSPEPAEQARVLECACSCLSALASQPGEAACDEDYSTLQQFAGALLNLQAAAPAAELGPANRSGTDQQQQALAQQPAACMPGDPSQEPAALTATAEPHPASSLLAQQMLSRLSRQASTGMVVLGCTAIAAQATMERLVQAVMGEPLAAAASPSSVLGSSGSDQAPAAEAAAEEARLAQAFARQAQLLQQGLRALPGWMAVCGGCDDQFVQEVAVALMAASDACKLVSLSHPTTARHMQRVSTHLVSALHYIAVAEQQPEQEQQGQE